MVATIYGCALLLYQKALCKDIENVEILKQMYLYFSFENYLTVKKIIIKFKADLLSDLLTTKSSCLVSPKPLQMRANYYERTTIYNIHVIRSCDHLNKKPKHFEIVCFWWKLWGKRLYSQILKIYGMCTSRNKIMFNQN